jgi:hypothetical protein
VNGADITDKLKVFDLQGKEILIYNLENSTINIGELNSGIYFAGIYSPSGNIYMMQKFVVVK